MEDEEEINNNGNGCQQPFRDDAGEGGLGMKETPTPTPVGQTEVVSNDNITEQCEFFSDPLPEFDDPVVSSISEASMAGAEMQIQVEDMLDPEMDDFPSPIGEDDVGAEGGGDDIRDTSALELADSLIVRENSPKDGESAGAEDAVVAEREVAAEGIVVTGSSGPRDGSQLAGLNLPDVSKDDEAGTEKQASTPLQEDGVKHAGSDEGIAGNENLIESQNGVGAESSVKEDHYEAEGKQGGTEDTNMDMQTEVANQVEVEKNYSPRVVDDSNDVDVDSPMGPRDDDDDDGDGEVVAEDVPIGDTEMETETDGTETADAGNGTSGGGKRKRGKVSKVPARNPARKVIEEDVCFICFDGGELVLCDRRGCPKAYHPSCVNRNESFFRAKGRWNCGWHLCSTCEKNAHYMCYTCTFSLCKACIKDAVILCVRGNKGFCETCMKTVMEIETNEQANKEGGVDYDDKSSWMYLFKDYWMDLKAKLSLSVDELAQARNPWKRSDVLVGKQELADDVPINDDGSGSDSSENVKVIKPKRRISKKRAKTVAKEYDVPGSATKMAAEGNSGSGRTEWASKELLEFVSHMKNGDKSVLSQFEVQALLLQYINTNNLRDPRRKSQIICDGRLQNIFAKARVGHFEMLKLLESHFLMKDDSQIDDVQGTAADTEANQLEPDGTNDTPVKGGKEKRRKTRKKNYERGRQSNLDDYAAIDVHNIGLIYLRRKLMEDLLDDLEKCDNVIDPEKFCDKVIGTFVRIRISGSNQKQDIYRLVQIAGTSRAAEPYKVGKKTTDIVLEILNLNKTEVVSIDTISNQEFTEDECKRLRQSIKCGLINRLTVGDVLDKALGLQAVRVKDWLESETVRLSHLRDRASEKGRKKELRECVEKLQLLKTPNERHRRLEEIPEIHADPKMDPSYESEEADSETEENKQEIFSRPRGSSFGRKGREPVSPRGGNFHSTDSWSGSRRNSLKNWDSNKLMFTQDPGKSTEANLVGEMLNNYAENQVRDRDVQRTTNMEKMNVATNTETVGHSSYGFAKSRSSSAAMSEVSHGFPSSGVDDTAFKVNESEKMWHYKDPSGKVQGPFSIVQLRKWNNTGYFPADLKIWKAAEKEDDSVLLTDALAGRFHKKLPQMDTSMTTTQTVQSPHLSSASGERPYRSTPQQGSEGEGEAGGGRLDLNQNNAGRRPPAEISSSTSWGTPSVEAPKFSADGRSSEYSRNDQINLPSPTPKLSTPDTSGGGQFSRASASVLVNQSGSKEHAAMGSQSPAPSSQIVSSMNAASPLQNSQTNATGESHGMHPHGESHGWGSGSTQRQEIVQNHSHTMPVQQAGYNQWGGIQSPGQNHIANFPNPGFPAMPQSEPWRPPVAVNQPNIQPNLPWGVSVPGANTYTTPPGPRPENANMFWNPMQGNPNMGWGGAAPGTLNMNWMASVPGQVPGWVAAPTANPVGMVHGNVNPGWVPQTVPHPGTVLPGPQPPASGNPAWGPPNGNPGSHNDQVSASVNASSAWGPPIGNQGVANNQGPAPVNANPSWSGLPAANSGGWGNDNQQGGQMDTRGGSGGKDFGNRGSRPWNRQSSFGGNGNGGNINDSNVQRGNWAMCRFHKAGTCRKGKHCRNRHT